MRISGGRSVIRTGRSLLFTRPLSQFDPGLCHAFTPISLHYGPNCDPENGQHPDRGADRCHISHHGDFRSI
jgi:hypothetical protein